jgi:6-phosphogluconolactonase
MKRFFVCLALLFTAALPNAQNAQKTAGQYFVYVGTYTAATSKGIYAFKFNPADGTLTPLGLVAETPNPAQVWASPNGKNLYAVNWQGTDAVKGDTVSAYAINPKTGALTFLNKVSSAGVQPNQVVVDPTGKMAVTVNYNTGTLAALPIESDGRVGEAFYVDQHTGQPLSPRQPGPRAHGSGPRRLQLHPNGKFLYLNHETDSRVSVFEVNGGNLKEIQSLSTLPPDYKGNNSTAEIQIDRKGRFLYVSNRGHDSVALYTVDPLNGTLTWVENIPTLGRTPRNITIDPTNSYLFAANQGGDNVVVFRIDHRTGHLTPAGTQVQVSQPGGIYLVKAQ